MKPVAIFRHDFTEGPGYSATYPEAHSIAWKLVWIDAGEVRQARGRTGNKTFPLPNEMARADAQGGGFRPSS
jgi:hypothetical protein